MKIKITRFKTYPFQKYKYVRASIYTFAFHNIKRGLLREAWYVIAVYLVLYYCVSIPTIQLSSCSNNNGSSTAENSRMPGDMEALVKEFQRAERSFTSLLIFFLGFFVSIMSYRWWRQVSGVPTIDEICQVLNGFVGIDSEARFEKRIIKMQQEFKRRIARYCLLSWTMCLSGLSLQMKYKFGSEREYKILGS